MPSFPRRPSRLQRSAAPVSCQARKTALRKCCKGPVIMSRGGKPARIHPSCPEFQTKTMSRAEQGSEWGHVRGGPRGGTIQHTKDTSFLVWPVDQIQPLLVKTNPDKRRMLGQSSKEAEEGQCISHRKLFKQLFTPYSTGHRTGKHRVRNQKQWTLDSCVAL